MKISATYRFIASILSLSILLGVSIPSGLHAMSEEVCDEMGIPMHPVSQHAEDCPINARQAEKPKHHHQTDKTHHNAHDFGFACTCSVEEAPPVKTEAKAQLTTKVPALYVVQVLTEIHTDESEIHAFQITVSNAYSPTPIYLANQSFLN